MCASSGEGGVARSIYYYQRRQLPFLKRNVRKSVRALRMGSTLSAVKRTIVGSRELQEPVGSSYNADEDPRPAKRRKLRPPEYAEDLATIIQEFEGVSTSDFLRPPLGQVMNESARISRSSKPPPVSPNGFYGKMRKSITHVAPVKYPGPLAKPKKWRVDSIFENSTPNPFKKALRIDVCGIYRIEHENYKLDTVPSQCFEISCRCSAAIFPTMNDDSNHHVRDISGICRISKRAKLRVSVGQDGEVRRDLIMSEPFIFSAEDFFVNRKENSNWPGKEGESHRIPDFADRYHVQFLLESYGTQEHWPPLDIPSFVDLPNFGNGFLESHPISKALGDRRIGRTDLQLSCRNSLLVSPEKQCKASNLSFVCKSLKQTCSYTLNIRIRWSVPSGLGALSTPPKFQSPRRSAPKYKGDLATLSPLADRSKDMSIPESPVPEGRTRRQRAVPQTYNLKALSAQAQGKSPRTRRTREDIGPKSEAAQEIFDEINITYCFGRLEAAENGINQQYTSSDLNCPFCLSRHRSLDELRVHLHGVHQNFKFSLRRGKPPRVSYFVQVIRNRSVPALTSDRARTIQIGKPMTLFNLEQYLNGDDLWSKSREGPQHSTFATHLDDHGQESSLSSSPYDSRNSSPNTSHATEEFTELDYRGKQPVRIRKKYYVPKTKRPLYDTVTKRRLDPGEEVPNSDDEKDESWFLQKQQDIINDYVDISPEEKDYINQWNPFIISKHLTSMQYLPNAILEFIQINKTWFAKNKTRKGQFLKHMEIFILRGVATEDLYYNCIDILRVEENSYHAGGHEDVDVYKDGEFDPSKVRGHLDCECCGLTQLPDRVICRGKKCISRYFHRECAQKYGRSIIGAWRCDYCIGK